MIKILVVDDDENSRVYLERALKSQNYLVEGAANGSQALEKAILAPPDIIISDILMPVMDGFELCLKIKTDRVLQNIPFVFYTSTYTEKNDEVLALSLGASRYILKPQDVQEMFRIIKEVLDEQKQKVEPPARLAMDKAKIDEMYSRTIARKLEKKVKDLEKSNEELRKKNEDLEKIIRGYAGQELRIAKFKDDVEELQNKIGEIIRKDKI